MDTDQIIDIKAVRKTAEKRKFGALVLDAFDWIKGKVDACDDAFEHLEHERRREQRDRAAEVRRAARNRL